MINSAERHGTPISNSWLYPLVIPIVTAIAYYAVLSAGFISWDDDKYITADPVIRSFSLANMSAWFSGVFVGNYHPLTMASYALDYFLSGNNPFGYHITNLLLHTANALLVYLFFSRLSSRQVAFWIALLFALHPCQVENVAWVAERKTLLSGFFTLSALLFYADKGGDLTGRRLAALALLSAGAMLSKATAVVLPGLFWVTDLWMHRSRTGLKYWIPLMPTLSLSLVFSYVAIQAQQSGAYLYLHTTTSFVDKLIFSLAAYSQYPLRLLFPVGLSAIYPYPGTPGAEHYIWAACTLGILALLVVAWRRGWKILSGGLLFFSFCIAPVLQFISFGEALTADRYVYLAALGIFFPIVQLLFRRYLEDNRNIVANAFLSLAAVTLLMMTFKRASVWQSDKTFFAALLETHPNSPVANYSMGAISLKEGDLTTAELYLNKAVRLDATNYKAWYDKGLLHLRQRNNREAMDAFNQCLQYNGNYSKALLSRALLYYALHTPDPAVTDLEKVLKQQPGNEKANALMGECLWEQNDPARSIKHFSLAIAANTRNTHYYLKRAQAYIATNDTDAATSDLKKAMRLQPANGEVFYTKALLDIHLSANPCDDLSRAVQLHFNAAQVLFSKYCNNN